MPKIICHECGRERVVVTGKRKNCRKCGTKLTDQQQPLDKLIAKQAALESGEPLVDSLTVEQLATMYPDQVAEIVEAVKADAISVELGDMKPQELEKAYPDECKAIVLKATNELAAKVTAIEADKKTAVAELEAKVTAAQADKKAAVAQAAINGKKSILKMSTKTFEKAKAANKKTTKKS